MCGAKSAWLPSMCRETSVLLPSKCGAICRPCSVNQREQRRLHSKWTNKLLQILYLPNIERSLFKPYIFMEFICPMWTRLRKQNVFGTVTLTALSPSHLLSDTRKTGLLLPERRKTGHLLSGRRKTGHFLPERWLGTSWCNGSCDLMANERPQNKLHGEGTTFNTQSNGHGDY